MHVFDAHFIKHTNKQTHLSTSSCVLYLERVSFSSLDSVTCVLYRIPLFKHNRNGRHGDVAGCMCQARRVASIAHPLQGQQAGRSCRSCEHAPVDDLPGRTGALRGRQGRGSAGGCQGRGGPADQDHHHQGRHPAQPGDQRVREEVRVRDGAHVRVLVPAPRGGEEARDRQQELLQRLRIRWRRARDHQLPPGHAGVRVGSGGGEVDGADSIRAGDRRRAAGAVVLFGGGAAVHVRVAGAHHERRVDGRAQLRAVHGSGGAVERAHCDAGVPGPGHHRGLHPLRRLRHVKHFHLSKRVFDSCKGSWCSKI